MCVFAEQSSAYDIVGLMDGECSGGKARHKAWNGSLSLPSTLNTNAVGKDTPGDSAGRNLHLGQAWHLLPVCTCLRLPVTPQRRVETGPTHKRRVKWPAAPCLEQFKASSLISVTYCQGGRECLPSQFAVFGEFLILTA